MPFLFNCKKVEENKIYIFAGVAILLGVGLYLYTQSEKTKARERELELEKQVAQAQAQIAEDEYTLGESLGDFIEGGVGIVSHIF